MKSQIFPESLTDRRRFLGGSDARIIMGDDEARSVGQTPPGMVT